MRASRAGACAVAGCLERARAHARIDACRWTARPFRPRIPSRRARSFATTSRRHPGRGWNALAGGSRSLSHAFLNALHETGCASPATGWRRATSPRGARAGAGRRAAALCQGPLVRRIRVRLGLGRCLPAPRSPLLPEARRGDSVHAGDGTAAPRRDAATRDALLAARAAQLRGRERGARRVVVAARALSDEPTKPRAARRRHDHPRTGAVPLGESRLPRLRRLPRDIQSRQAQEDEAGAAQGRRCRRRRSRARSGGEITRGRLGFLLSLLREHLPRAPLDALPVARVLRAHRRDDAATSAAVVGQRDGRPVVRGAGCLRRRRRCGVATGARPSYVPGLHFEACYYQAIEFCIERRIARFEGGAQGVHKLARGLTAGDDVVGARDRRPGIRARDRRVLRARARRRRARRRRARRGEPVQGRRRWRRTNARLGLPLAPLRSRPPPPMNDTVLLARDGPVATLTLNRPDALNVARPRDDRRARRAHGRSRRRRSVRVVVVRGAGQHFMAGGDIRMFAGELERAAARAQRAASSGWSARSTRRSNACIGCRIRSSARVHGAVAGFGLSLMNACDLVIAADDAYFASAYRHIALTPDGGGSWSLPRLVGRARRWRSCCFGERFDAAEALAIGLVNKVVPRDELDAAVAARRNSLAAGPGSRCATRSASSANRSTARCPSSLQAEAVSFGAMRRHRRFRRRHHRVPRPSGRRSSGAGDARQHATMTTLDGKTLVHHRRFARHRPRDRGPRGARRRQRRDRREDRRAQSKAARNDPHGRGRDRAGRRHGAADRLRHPRRDAPCRRRSPRPSRAFGGIDILVNNASAISLTGTLATPMKRFDLMFGVNVRGTFLCSQACLPHLKASAAAGRNPHILTLSPPLNLDPRWFRDHVAYTMAKYGMSMCVLGMAEEFRGDGIARQRAVAAHGDRDGGRRDDPGRGGARRPDAQARDRGRRGARGADRATRARPPAASSSTKRCWPKPASPTSALRDQARRAAAARPLSLARERRSAAFSPHGKRAGFASSVHAARRWRRHRSANRTRRMPMALLPTVRRRSAEP